MISVLKPFVYNNCISVKAASKYSGYSQQYLRRMLRLGKLTGLKLGQVWLVDLNSLESYLSLALNSEDQRFSPKL
jgi:hypothetical protein